MVVWVDLWRIVNFYFPYAQFKLDSNIYTIFFPATHGAKALRERERIRYVCVYIYIYIFPCLLQTFLEFIKILCRHLSKPSITIKTHAMTFMLDLMYAWTHVHFSFFIFLTPSEVLRENFNLGFPKRKIRRDIDLKLFIGVNVS